MDSLLEQWQLEYGVSDDGFSSLVSIIGGSFSGVTSSLSRNRERVVTDNEFTGHGFLDVPVEIAENYSEVALSFPGRDSAQYFDYYTPTS